MKRLFAIGTAAAMLLAACPLTAAAAEAPVPVDIEEAVYSQLIEAEIYDPDKDGVITAEEFQAAEILEVNLKNVTSLDFLAKAGNLKALWLSEGEIDDLSPLADCKGLVTLGLYKMPNVTDISVIKELDLNTIYLNEMEQITDEQRLELLKFHDADTEVGYAALIGGTPCRILDSDAFSIEIENPDIACFDDTYGNPNGMSAFPVVGLEIGETTYTVSCRDEVIYTGTIRVGMRIDHELPTEEPVEAPDVLESWYYAPNMPVVRQNGTVYRLQNGGLVPIEEHVADWQNGLVYDEFRQYHSADIVLHTDGTVTVNGIVPDSTEPVKGKKIRGADCITEDRKLYTCRMHEGRLFWDQISEHAADFPENSPMYYISDEGMVMLIRTAYTKEGDISIPSYQVYGTGIKNIIGDKNDNFIDENHVLWNVSRLGSGAPTVRQKATDVVFVGYRDYDHFTYGCVYITSDGTAHAAETGKVVTLTPGEVTGSDDQKSGSFFGNALGRYESAFSVPDYRILDDGVMTMQYNDKRISVTNVKSYLAATEDEEYREIDVYFIRTDNTLWSVRFWTGEFAKAAVLEAAPAVAGDANGDGTLNTADTVLLQKWLLGMPDSAPADPEAADMNGDHSVDAKDLTLMKQALLQ